MTTVEDPRTELRTCHLCEAMCGLTLQVQGHQVLDIRPNPDDVWSRGHICPKGMQIARLHEDPDRLRAPMIRTGTQWREVSWEEAFSECERLIHGVVEKYGKSALVGRTGNMAGHNFSLMRYVAAFAMQAGITMYSSSTVDQQPKNVVCDQMYGNAWAIPVPDISRTDLFLVMGGNPKVSKGSILAHPDIMGAIDDIRRRGGRTLVVDPVRSETARVADEWIPVLPGTDAWLLLGVTHVLYADGLVNLGSLVDKVRGTDELRVLAAPFTPELASSCCGVPADRIRQLAHELSDAPRAAVYGRIGLCTQEFGTLASWLVEMLAILTGNLDRPGGSMFPKPVAPFMSLLPQRPGTYGTWRSRVRGAPEVLGQLPPGCLAEEIDTPGEGQVKGLITIAANPVVTAPDSARLDAALPLLECMISVDAYLNETTRHAHVVLPATSALEQPYFDVWSWCFALTSGAKYADALFASPAGWVPEWEVLLRLGALCAGKTSGEIDLQHLDDEYFGRLCVGAGIDPERVRQLAPEPGPIRICDLAVRVGPWGDRYGERPGGLTLDQVREHANGIMVGESEPRLAEVLRTESGKVELAPTYITDDLERLVATPPAARDGLQLIGRRHLRSMNSWMHNVEPLARGRGRNDLLMNTADAARLGLETGAEVVVTSASGSVSAPLRVSPDIVAGVVSLPHGWGHGADGTRTSIAKKHPGVNSNVLAPGDLIDVISNNAVLNGIPVVVTRKPE